MFKVTWSVTINIFRNFFGSFEIICQKRIKLCFHNKYVQNNRKLNGKMNYLIKTGDFSLDRNYLRPSNNSRL